MEGIPRVVWSCDLFYWWTVRSGAWLSGEERDWLLETLGRELEVVRQVGDVSALKMVASWMWRSSTSLIRFVWRSLWCRR